MLAKVLLIASMATTRRIAPRDRRVSADYLGAWLNYLGVNQNALAARLGVNPATVSKWIKGTNGINADAAISIAEALGIEEVDLFRWPGRTIDAQDLSQREAEAIDRLSKLDAARRRHALGVIEALLNYGD